MLREKEYVPKILYPVKLSLKDGIRHFVCKG